MKYSILIMTLAMSANVMAFGDNSSRASSSSRSTAVAGASAHQAQGQGQIASQQGNTTNVSDSSVYEDTKQHKNTPSMGVAGLTASNLTCLGSASVSGAIAGFGIGGASTVMDESCNLRQMSIRLQQLGMYDASQRIMCQDESVKVAMELTGFDCGKDADNAPANIPATTYQSNSGTGFGFMQ